jgi:hypothetical protein
MPNALRVVFLFTSLASIIEAPPFSRASAAVSIPKENRADRVHGI